MSARVAVAQTAPRVGELQANLADAEAMIHSLAGRAELVIFPELFSTGYRREGFEHAAMAEPIPDGPTVRRLSRAAADAGVGVIGTILERADGQVYDTALVIGAEGHLVGRYRKTHLYPAERRYFASGEELVVAGLGAMRVGLAICFEHAFPEVFTELALRGAELVAIPSAVPVGYEYLLELRTRARAQDNQVFVAAANLVGDDGVTTWCGRSMIVNPRGEVVAEAVSDATGTIIAEVDLRQGAAERDQEPALSNRRPELYRHLAPEARG
ncbi:MAG: carbon-nitrogen hydrolase family protein [Candidatus Limnocylindria bacterium]